MSRQNSKIRRFVLALAGTALAAGLMAGPALAADWGPHGRPEQHWRHHEVYRQPVYAQPVYAAPYTVVAPAPVAVVTAPALNLVIPLNFH
jgi:hypothetical protein